MIVAVLGLSTTFTMAPAAWSTAGAQTFDRVGPHSVYCGAWQNGVWMANGNCQSETTTTTTTTVAMPMNERTPGSVRGTITGVTGHLVTIQQSSQSLVIDDHPALDRKRSGRVAVGREVMAHGYWDHGTFYATGLDTKY